MSTTYDSPKYTATQASPAHAWVITRDDGVEVLALPFDMPALVARAVAAAMQIEVEEAS